MYLSNKVYVRMSNQRDETQALQQTGQKTMWYKVGLRSLQDLMLNQKLLTVTKSPVILSENAKPVKIQDRRGSAKLDMLASKKSTTMSSLYLQNHIEHYSKLLISNN